MPVTVPSPDNASRIASPLYVPLVMDMGSARASITMDTPPSAPDLWEYILLVSCNDFDHTLVFGVSGTEAAGKIVFDIEPEYRDDIVMSALDATGSCFELSPSDDPVGYYEIQAGSAVVGPVTLSTGPFIMHIPKKLKEGWGLVHQMKKPHALPFGPPLPQLGYPNYGHYLGPPQPGYTYQKGDIVNINGNPFIAKCDNPGAPPTSAPAPAPPPPAPAGDGGAGGA